MRLATDNLKVQDILTGLKITTNSAADIYYKTNGTKKSYSEFLELVKGVFDPNFCPSSASAYNKQDLRSFLGYKSDNLNLSRTFYTASWLGDQCFITVYGVDSYEVSYSSNIINVRKEKNNIIISWSPNLTYEGHDDIITVSGGGKSIEVNLYQNPKPKFTGLPSKISLTGNLPMDGAVSYNFTCNYSKNYISAYFLKNNVGFSALIVSSGSGLELDILFHPRLLSGSHQYIETDILCVSCSGFQIEINCSANLFYDDGRIEERIQT